MIRATLFLCLVLSSLSAHAQDVSLDKQLGTENALIVEQEMGIYRHDSLYNLVKAVGEKLVSRLRAIRLSSNFF